MSASPPVKRSFWPVGGEKCWSSDAGWGCMVRTSQSLLANTLVFVHLGRGASHALPTNRVCQLTVNNQNGANLHIQCIPPIMRHTCKL